MCEMGGGGERGGSTFLDLRLGDVSCWAAGCTHFTVKEGCSLLRSELFEIRMLCVAVKNNGGMNWSCVRPRCVRVALVGRGGGGVVACGCVRTRQGFMHIVQLMHA